MQPSPAIMPVRRLAADPTGIEEAAAILRRGGLVAFPTETVYGLGADARSDTAVAAVYRAKGRPAENPLIVHLRDLDEAGRLVDFPAPARLLAERCWPGPLTLVLPRREGSVAAAASGGLDTLAVRVPAHPVAMDLLEAFGGPLVGPSANPSGRVSPTEPAHVLEGLDGRIDALLEAGACKIGIESTIIGFDRGAATLLRSGAVPAAEIAELLGRPLRAPSGTRPQAPGAYGSHYAPAAELRIEARAPESGEAWLGFGPDPETAAAAEIRASLSPVGDLDEAARRLYGLLHELDAALGGKGRIAVARIPETGAGIAVNDRLRRGAAPRGV